MGTGCSKASTTYDGQRKDGLTTRKKKVHTADENWTNYFAITIDCYYVPSDRILSHPTAVLGSGAGCRSVAVTTINIEEREKKGPTHRSSKLNSAIYTPEIQWFGIDIKQQVPRYLPMNLWPGSYTMFGFYNQEQSGSTFVQLTAKCGPDKICLQEPMETERRLSNENWSHLACAMEKELQKLITPVKRPSYEPISEKRLVKGKSILTSDETNWNRISQDTGYMSPKRSKQQSPFSVTYIGNTSDSEDAASLKEKYPQKHKSKLRRKDTPAHGLHALRPSQLSQDIRDSPLQEESEAINPSGRDASFSCPRELVLTRRISALDLYTVDEQGTSLKYSEKGATGMSKSYCDLRECTSPLKSPSYSEGGKTLNSGRKKQSIISKLSGKIRKTESVTSLLEAAFHLERENDIDADADDEAEVSYTENDMLVYHPTDAQMKVESQTKDGEEINDNSTSVDVATEKAFTFENPDNSQEERCSNDQTVEDQTGKINCSKDEKDHSGRVDRQLKPNSLNDSSGLQMESLKALDTHLRSTNAVEENDNEPRTFDEVENDQMKVSDKQRNEITGDESATGGTTTEQKSPDEFPDTNLRPRSRTLSKTNVYENKEPKERYHRMSKSVSVSSKISTRKRGDKKTVSSFQGRSNDKTSSMPLEPPLTPKEAFSDS